MVKYICNFWRNGQMPQWRKECVDRLISFYPDAEVIESVLFDYVSDPRGLCENWKIEQVSKYDNLLWVDSDIYLDTPLELPEGPAMADECKCNHASIVWTGNDSKYFKGKTFMDVLFDSYIKRIKITGVHWTSDRMGNKGTRRR